jgi:hypothetical protein
VIIAFIQLKSKEPPIWKVISMDDVVKHVYLSKFEVEDVGGHEIGWRNKT